MESNKKIILKNGLRLLFLQQKNAKTAALGLAIDAGPYFEEESVSGVSHLLEHFIGRQKEGRVTLREAIYENSGIADASTSVTQTYFHLYTRIENLTENAKVLTKGVYFPKFGPITLDRSKESVLSEMSFSVDFSPYEILRKLMWKDPRLSRSIIGSKESIIGVTLEKLEEYHKYYYCSNNTSVVVIAPAFPEELVEVLEKIPSNKDLLHPAVDVSLKKPSFRIFQERNLHSTIAFSFPTAGYIGLGEDRHLFNIAATSLNDYFIAELGKSGLVYEANWNWNIFPRNGDFVVYLESLENHHVIEALKKGLKLMSRWSGASATTKNFDLIRKHIILNLLIETSQVDELVLFTKNFASSEEAHTYEEAVKVYQDATLKDTLRVVRSILLTDEPYCVVNLGVDSMNYVGQINQVLEDFYKNG